MKHPLDSCCYCQREIQSSDPERSWKNIFQLLLKLPESYRCPMVLVSRWSECLWVAEDPRRRTVRTGRGLKPQSPTFCLTPKHTRPLVADGLMLLSSFYRENILVLDIFFEALNYETIEQKKAYEVAALLGKERSGVRFGVHVCLGDRQVPRVGAQVMSLAMKSQQDPASFPFSFRQQAGECPRYHP